MWREKGQVFPLGTGVPVTQPVLAAGPVRIQSPGLPAVGTHCHSGFVFARSGMQRNIPVIVCYLWGWGGGGCVCVALGWQSSHKVSRHSWFGNSATESGVLASVYLGPGVGLTGLAHKPGIGQASASGIKEGNWLGLPAARWLAPAPFRGGLGVAVEVFQCLGRGSVCLLPVSPARPGPSGIAKNELLLEENISYM